jgi:hypothetical protein
MIVLVVVHSVANLLCSTAPPPVTCYTLLAEEQQLQLLRKLPNLQRTREPC